MTNSKIQLHFGEIFYMDGKHYGEILISGGFDSFSSDHFIRQLRECLDLADIKNVTITSKRCSCICENCEYVSGITSSYEIVVSMPYDNITNEYDNILESVVTGFVSGYKSRDAYHNMFHKQQKIDAM